MKRLPSFILLLAFGLSSVCLSAQGSGTLASERLPLLPYPSQITVGDTDFTVGNSCGIAITSRSEEDAFAVSTFTGDFESTLWQVRSGARYRRGAITVARIGEDKTADRLLAEAGLSPDPESDESYVLLADEGKVIVGARGDKGIFYGLQTLRQLTYSDPEGRLKVRAVKISDTPALRYRWIQDDWNRGPIPNVEYVKKQIRILSEYKINGYCIYAENIFKSEKYPQINMRGAVVTPEEVRELVEYGKKYHVELVPQQECLGHMHYTLREGGFDDIAERPRGQIVSPAVERTYTFLNDYLGEIVPNFESEFVHVGCDEAFELGLGKSGAMVGEMGLDGVFFHHLDRVMNLPAIKDKKALFWADVAVGKPDIDLSVLPDNAVAVAWEYLPLDNYEYYLPQFQKNGIPFFVAPGAFWSTRVFPNFSDHMVNIRGFVRDGKKYGAIGMLCCNWDDMGEDLFDVGWLGVTFAAACAWQNEPETSIEDFKQAFDWAFYRNASGHQFVDAIMAVADVQRPVSSTLMADWIWTVPFEPGGAGQQNHLQNLNLEELRSTVSCNYGRLHQCLPLAHHNESTLDAVLFCARRLGFVLTKASLAAGLSQRYEAFCNDEDKGRVVNTALYDIAMPQCGLIGSLRDYTMELKDWHRELWMQENRPYHWAIIEERYNQLLKAWDDQLKLINRHLGAKSPREEAGFIYSRTE
ncbi:MAG: glycoside hydrolase family 20 zincin-like fold domain-containing protein [Candidatus Cryptobacteroides sp.]